MQKSSESGGFTINIATIYLDLQSEDQLNFIGRIRYENKYPRYS